MNVKKFQEAMVSLEQLHWHLHWNGGADLWTTELLRQFQAAIDDNGSDAMVGPTEETAAPAE